MYINCVYTLYFLFSVLLKDNVQDIEQLTLLGKDLDTCPYYGTRHSISDAQVSY